MPVFNPHISINQLSDIHHYLNMVFSPEAEGGQIHLNVVSVLLSSKTSTDIIRGLVGEKFFTGCMPLLTPNHSYKTKVFHREHALADSKPQL